MTADELRRNLERYASYAALQQGRGNHEDAARCRAIAERIAIEIPEAEAYETEIRARRAA